MQTLVKQLWAIKRGRTKYGFANYLEEDQEEEANENKAILAMSQGTVERYAKQYNIQLKKSAEVKTHG